MTFVCLGNPGKKYKKTRHNFGRLFGEYLIDRLAGSRVKRNKFGEVFKLENNWEVVFLNCYMNESGKCLKKIIDNQSLAIDHLFLVHDDLDLPFGQFKIQFGRGAAGHHGVESVVEALGTKEFWRVRLGIGRPPGGIEPEGYVLMPFADKEMRQLPQIFSAVLQQLQNSL